MQRRANRQHVALEGGDDLIELDAALSLRDRRLQDPLMFGAGGWLQYFQHIKGWKLARLDGWIRTRLRTILWKHQKGKGMAPETAKYRWPSSVFDRRALYSLARARAEISRVRSSGRPPTGEPCA